MTNGIGKLSNRYDAAAPKWGDKMRTLGYYDGYLGFLSSRDRNSTSGSRVIDVGAGTAAFSEAWVALHGAPRELTLLEPSRAMLDRGCAALQRRGVTPTAVLATLADADVSNYDVALAAHVIEHCPSPLHALQHIRDMLSSGGRLHLVVSKPHWCSAIIWLQWRHRTFQEDEILALLENAGFDTEFIYAFPSGPPSRTSRGIVAVRK